MVQLLMEGKRGNRAVDLLRTAASAQVVPGAVMAVLQGARGVHDAHSCRLPGNLLKRCAPGNSGLGGLRAKRRETTVVNATADQQPVRWTTLRRFTKDL